MKKAQATPTLRSIAPPKKQRKTPSHHVRLTPELQAWAEAKAKTYRSVAAFIVDLVREAYQWDQAEQRKAA